LSKKFYYVKVNTEISLVADSAKEAIERVLSDTDWIDEDIITEVTEVTVRSCPRKCKFNFPGYGCILDLEDRVEFDSCPYYWNEEVRKNETEIRRH